MYLQCTQLYGVLKNKGGVGFLTFHKRTNLFSLLKKLSAIWSNLTLHHPSLPLPKASSFLSFVQVENVHEHLIEKIFLVCFSLLSPQVEQNKDDEHFANHLQIYLSRTFTKAKKFLKIEEVEYLIHYVKFKMQAENILVLNPQLFYLP